MAERSTAWTEVDILARVMVHFRIYSLLFRHSYGSVGYGAAPKPLLLSLASVSSFSSMVSSGASFRLSSTIYDER